MRRSIPFLVLLLTTTACGQAYRDNGSGSGAGAGTGETSNAAADVAVGEPIEVPELPTPGRAGSAGPDVRPTTAPGVAFNYRYSFRLEAQRVAEAQQEHQRLCERYGVSRCRITGMTYRAATPDDVEAMLAFRVDPAIAGQFGRESVQAVTAAEGTLTDSEINGTDVGGAIREAGRSIAQLEADLARVEARLRAAGTSAGDKGQLEYEAQQLRQQIHDLRGSRDTQQQSLATTPMLFRYGSGNLAPGPAQPTTLREAVGDTGDDLLYSLNLMLVVLVRLLPWAIPALLIWGLVALVRRRRPGQRAVPVPAIEAEPVA